MARKAQRVWRLATPRRKSPVVPEGEREAIILACERFVREVLKPRFLPRVVPTEWNYPVDIRGAWHGGRYRFIQRFRSDRADSIVPEFDAPFARIECASPGLCAGAYLSGCETSLARSITSIAFGRAHGSNGGR